MTRLPRAKEINLRGHNHPREFAQFERGIRTGYLAHERLNCGPKRRVGICRYRQSMPKGILCRARFASFCPGAGAGASIFAIGGKFLLASHAKHYPFNCSV